MYLKYYDVIDSTNDEAFRLISSIGSDTIIAGGEIVLLSRIQFKGRGKGDRHWISNDGGLYTTLMFANKAGDGVMLSVIATMSVGYAISSFFPSISNCIRYKWPNDVLVYGKKIAGVLVEFLNDIPIAIVGIGVNVNSVPKELSHFSIMCCNTATRDMIDSLSKKIWDRFNFLYRSYVCHGFDLILKDFLLKSNDKCFVRARFNDLGYFFV